MAAPEDSEVDILHAAKQGDVDRFWLPLRRTLGQDVGIMGADSAPRQMIQNDSNDEGCAVMLCPVHVNFHVT